MDTLEKERGIAMIKDRHHSARQVEAGKVQSRADTTGQGKAAAGALQSAADKAAMKKHGKNAQ